MRLAALPVLALLAACAPGPSERASTTLPEAPDLDGATEVQLWATVYYVLLAEAATGPGTVPLRDMTDEVIGPALAERTWCAAAIEGTVKVDGQVYNYAGRKRPRQADCPDHRPSERLRWALSPHPYGTGSQNNPLHPFRTIACDLGTVSGSTPWLNGGYARFGQRVYVPDARGTLLPDGSRHDGMFRCGDVGGKITGNHVDVFIGEASGWRDALRRNPFGFVTSDPERTFRAFVLP